MSIWRPRSGIPKPGTPKSGFLARYRDSLECLRTSGATRKGALWVGVITVGLSLALSAPQVAARGDTKDPPPPIAPEVIRLTGKKPETRQIGLDVLRDHFQSARHVILEALDRKEKFPGRWRVVHRMIEFGEMEDIPVLLALLEGSKDPWERKIIGGTTRALYQPPEKVEDLSTVVLEFSFVQTGSARRIPNKQEGSWMLSGWSFNQLHRSKLPFSVVKKLLSMRKKGFSTREGLEKVLKSRLRKRGWRRYGAIVTAVMEKIPERIGLEGLARVRLRNPLERPLLLQVSLGAWSGRFARQPAPTLVYLPPGGEGGVDIPIRPQGNLDREAIRLDLRLREVNGSTIPTFSKVYIPLRG